jgi:hypothetical protein
MKRPALSGADMPFGNGEPRTVAHRLQPLGDRRCAMCGTPGRTPTLAASPDDSRPVLRVAFGVRQDGCPGLICPRSRERGS